MVTDFSDWSPEQKAQYTYDKHKKECMFKRCADYEKLTELYNYANLFYEKYNVVDESVDFYVSRLKQTLNFSDDEKEEIETHVQNALFYKFTSKDIAEAVQFLYKKCDPNSYSAMRKNVLIMATMASLEQTNLFIESEQRR